QQQRPPHALDHLHVQDVGGDGVPLEHRVGDQEVDQGQHQQRDDDGGHPGAGLRGAAGPDGGEVLGRGARRRRGGGRRAGGSRGRGGGRRAGGSGVRGVGIGGAHGWGFTSAV